MTQRIVNIGGGVVAVVCRCGHEIGRYKPLPPNLHVMCPQCQEVTVMKDAARLILTGTEEKFDRETRFLVKYGKRDIWLPPQLHRLFVMLAAKSATSRDDRWMKFSDIGPDPGYAAREIHRLKRYLTVLETDIGHRIMNNYNGAWKLAFESDTFYFDLSSFDSYPYADATAAVALAVRSMERNST